MLLGILAIAGADQVAGGRTGRVVQPFQLHGGDHVGVAAIAILGHDGGVKVVETGGDDDGADILPGDLVLLAEIDGIQLAAGLHALVAVDAVVHVDGIDQRHGLAMGT